MRVVADVVVIGAGVIGCSAALGLSQVRGTRVVVVEKGSIGSGMTKRSGGMVRTSFPLESEAKLALQSLHTYQAWQDSVGGSCGFTRTGLATLADQGQNALSVRKMTEGLAAIGANAQLLTAKQLHDLQPFLATEGVEVAAYEPDAGYADPVATTRSLAARAKELGTVFQTGTLVKSILVERGRVFGVSTNAGEIETLNVVLAAGPWSDRLLKPLGLEIGILPELVQVAFFDRQKDERADHIGLMDKTTGAYFRPHSYGLTQAGLLFSDPLASVNPDRFDEEVAPEFVSDVQTRLARRLPALAQARYVRGHTGVYDMTADGHPVIDRVPGIHGLVVAAGFSGSGFTLAPATGACIMELVIEGAASKVDLGALGFNRFLRK